MKIINNDKNKFEQPEFLLAEIPIKDGTTNDDRIWVYCTKTFSLIEFVLKDEFPFTSFTGTQNSYVYTDLDGYKESWLGLYIQNNCALVGQDPIENMIKAWTYLVTYFKWEELEEDFN